MKTGRQTTSSTPVSGVKIYLRLLAYVKSQWGVFLISVMGFLLYGAMEPALAAQLKYIVDVVSSGSIEENRYLIPGTILGIFLLRGIGTFFGSYFMARIANQVVYQLRTTMFDKLVLLPTGYYSEMPSGRLLSKLTYDTEQVVGAVTSAVKTLLREGLTVIGLLGFMLYINWRLSLLFLLIIPVIGFVVSYASKRFRKLSKRIQNAMGGISDVASESIKGHEVVKIFGGSEYECDRFRMAAGENKRTQLKMELTKALNIPVVQFLVAISLAVLIWFALDPNLSQHMSAGDFVAFIGAAGMLSKPARQLTDVNSILQKGIAAAQSIFEFIDLDEESDVGKKAVGELRGKVEWRNLSFQYPSSDRIALDTINLILPAGKTLALVGRSGGGKSTLANLVPRLYDASSGGVFIDELDTREYQLRGLRRKIALVNQNVVLFNGTIRQNIAYGDLRDASEDDVIAAAKAANAWEFIERLENGLDTTVGENGVLLSGGQRQRIAIARAILKNAPILILDEATSALDTESERSIQLALDSLMKNRTTIAIAHRLSTIENADIIAVVDQGKIIEVGSHKELLQRNGAYFQLHQNQFNDD